MKQKRIRINKDLRKILFFSLCAVLFATITGSTWHQWDSDSYLQAGQNFFSGSIDPFRTPGYSCLVYLFNSAADALAGLFPESIVASTAEMFHGGLSGIFLFLMLLLFQTAVFLVSVCCFYHMAAYFIKKRTLFLIAVYLYACHPASIAWHKMMMTESLALSLSVIYMYLMVLFAVRKSYKACIGAHLLLIYILLLRPSFIYLLPIDILVLACLLLRKRSKAYITGLLCALAVGAGFMGYQQLYKQKHGVFATSNVGDINQYWILMEHGLVRKDGLRDDMRADIERFEAQGVTYRSDHILEYFELESKYGIKECHRMVSRSLSKNFRRYFKSRIRTFFLESQYSPGCWDEQRDAVTRIGLFTSPNFFQFYLFLLVYFVCWLRVFRKKRNGILTLFLCLSAVGGTFVVVAGAPTSWSRLIVPCIPLALILFVQTAEFAIERFKKHILEKNEVLR